jgi:hypothetical protein
VTDEGVTYLMVARLDPRGIEQFAEYERLVLPLVGQHGGRLERRLVTADRLIEVHLVWFPSTEAFSRYRDDDRRTAHAHLLAKSAAEIELLELGEHPNSTQ